MTSPTVRQAVLDHCEAVAQAMLEVKLVQGLESGVQAVKGLGTVAESARRLLQALKEERDA